MSALSKEQKDELVTSYAALALYDGDVSQSYCSFIDGMAGSVDDGCLAGLCRDWLTDGGL